MKTQAELTALISDDSTSLADAWQAIQDLQVSLIEAVATAKKKPAALVDLQGIQELQTKFIERIARVATEQHATKKKPVAKSIVIDADATLITTEQAANVLGISKKSMSNYGSPSTRAAYAFPVEPQKIGARVMWDRAAIEALAAERAAAQNA